MSELVLELKLDVGVVRAKLVCSVVVEAVVFETATHATVWGEEVTRGRRRNITDLSPPTHLSSVRVCCSRTARTACGAAAVLGCACVPGEALGPDFAMTRKHRGKLGALYS